MLIPSAHALDLVVEGKAAEALANATRRIGALTRDGLGDLTCSDILVALAELELRSRSISPEMLTAIRATADAIEAARAAITSAQRAHARARSQVLAALGYREEAEKLDAAYAAAATEASA